MKYCFFLSILPTHSQRPKRFSGITDINVNSPGGQTKYNTTLWTSITVTGNNSNDQSTTMYLGTTRDNDPIAVYSDVFYYYYRYFFSFSLCSDSERERGKIVTRQAFKIKHDTMYRNARAPGFVILFLSHAQFSPLLQGTCVNGIALSLTRITAGLLYFSSFAYSGSSGHSVDTVSGYRLFLVVSTKQIGFSGDRRNFTKKFLIVKLLTANQPNR